MRGYSLLELTAALALLALVWSALTPRLVGYHDRTAVLAAREVLVGLLLETRTAAVRAGGASLHIDATSGRAWITVGDSRTREQEVGDGRRVSVVLGGGRTQTEIPYSGLGLGVFANETVELIAGSERARLVVSAYGRVRRD
ncbi:MAG: hypothetical protein WD995_12560 [Gemmatimonadota bacterium]